MTVDTRTAERQDVTGRTVGPGTAPALVFEAFESHGRADPATAWASFSADWNWAAALPHSVTEPGPDGALPVAVPVPGGYSLSGHWHLPRDREVGQWLVLPLVGGPDGPSQAAAEPCPDRPDVFVIASRVLPPQAAQDATFRLDHVHIPAGFAAHSTGTPLLERDTVFLWTAVAGAALGAVSRLVDELAALVPGRAATVRPSPGALTSPAARPSASTLAAAAELSALLDHERLAFTAELHNHPVPGRLATFTAHEPLSQHVRRLALVVHHVATAAYEHALPFPAADGRHSLESLVADSTAILQHLRFTVDLMSAAVDVGSPGSGPR